jgi:hypothetical protein
MVQSPSWAADRLAASQEIPRISRNPKVKKLPYNYASLQLLMLSQLILHSLSFQPSEMLKNSSSCEQIHVYSPVPDWLWQYGLCVIFHFSESEWLQLLCSTHF